MKHHDMDSLVMGKHPAWRLAQKSASRFWTRLASLPRQRAVVCAAYSTSGPTSFEGRKHAPPAARPGRPVAPPRAGRARWARILVRYLVEISCLKNKTDKPAPLVVVVFFFWGRDISPAG